jgi:ankyrin repeat protein
MSLSVTYFSCLPQDLQREVCWLLREHKEIKKLSPSFYDNPNDVYWKEKISTVSDEKTPEGTSHRDFYESFVYEKFISNRYWTNNILDTMMQDEIFLERHIDMSDKYGWTALTQFLYSRKSCVAHLLLTKGANPNYENIDGWTPLLRSICNSEEEIVTLLLHFGANINYQNKLGQIPLLVAAIYLSKDMLKLFLTPNNVNHQDPEGWTALMYAIAHQKKDNAELLLAAGADVNRQNRDGNTPLMKAVDTKNLEIIKILLSAGANVNIKNKRDMKAIDWASEPEIKRLLS